MSDIITVVAQISALTFVLTSMFGMGLSLTVGQIIEPLKDARRVAVALVANFILVPALAFGIQWALSLDEGLATGLVIVGAAAGAPFLPKLVQIGKGDAAFSVGLMTLLMVVTVIYVPLALPLLLPGVSVDPMEIAQSLIATMLLPLGIGLFVRARYEETAAALTPPMNQVSSVTLVLMGVGVLFLQFGAIVDTIGTGGLIAAALFAVGSLAIGLLLGGSDSKMRTVMGLGTGQRNAAAALLVAATNFADDPDVVIMVMLVTIVGGVILGVAGSEIGKRAEGAAG